MLCADSSENKKKLRYPLQSFTTKTEKEKHCRYRTVYACHFC